MPQVEPEKVSLHNNINQNLVKVSYKSLLSAFALGLRFGLSRIIKNHLKATHQYIK